MLESSISVIFSFTQEFLTVHHHSLQPDSLSPLMPGFRTADLSKSFMTGAGAAAVIATILARVRRIVLGFMAVAVALVKTQKKNLERAEQDVEVDI